jgi:trimeric autotransporter adhesin
MSDRRSSRSLRPQEDNSKSARLRRRALERESRTPPPVQVSAASEPAVEAAQSPPVEVTSAKTAAVAVEQLAVAESAARSLPPVTADIPASADRDRTEAKEDTRELQAAVSPLPAKAAETGQVQEGHRKKKQKGNASNAGTNSTAATATESLKVAGSPKLPREAAQIVDAESEEFFSSPVLLPDLDDAEPDEIDHRARILHSEPVRQKRAVRTRYVAIALGALSVLALGAGYKRWQGSAVSVSSAAVVVPPPSAAVTQAAVTSASSMLTSALVVQSATAQASVAPPDVSPSAAMTGAPSASATVTAASAAASASASASTSAEPAPSASSGLDEAEKRKEAAKAKRKAQGFLEGGAYAKAIDEAKKSTELDPTDGEAWLILGAAYQEKGQGAEARKAYAACLKEGKRGPKGDCAAMLR